MRKQRGCWELGAGDFHLRTGDYKGCLAFYRELSLSGALGVGHFIKEIKD